jgi:xanthine dehydrogenase accessory factor
MPSMRGPTVRQHDDADEAHDPACDVAHGVAGVTGTDERRLVVVYATPLASVLLRWASELGFSTVLVEPEGDRVDDEHGVAGRVVHRAVEAEVDGCTDVVVSDHHRDDLGETMGPLLLARPRWLGIIGSPRHRAPHLEALRSQGIEEELIGRVHRPIGLDIGSRTPAEIALSILAGLLADRNGRMPSPAGP